MTKAEIISNFSAALRSIGYEQGRIRPNYVFADLTGSGLQTRNISLAAFAGYPESYRNARVGVIVGDDAATPHDHRALGASLVMTVQGDTVQPWAISMDGAERVGNAFRVQDVKRVFTQNRLAWSPEVLGRVKSTSEVVVSSQADVFDTGLTSGLSRQFQTRLKELLEHSFKVIEAAYKDVHGRQPRISNLFGFLFRFLTAKIFMDRADAVGWGGLHDPLEILKAAEKQIGLLDRPASEFRRKHILDAAWSSIKSTLHFQNLSVPDLAFVAESAFITESTRDELGVHSTPAGLAEYMVNQMPWDQIPVSERVVLEPFCGHGIFLAKALERMSQDLDRSLSAQERHAYFRERLIGVETDPLSVEICRLVLTLSDYPNDNSWQLHHEDVFKWPEWQKTLRSASVILANPPYEAFAKSYRRKIKAIKTKPPAELLRWVFQQPPRLLGLVVPQSFLTDPVYRDANRAMARRYESIKIVELPRIFRYADNETIALVASGLRTAGTTVQVHYAEVLKDGVERFLEDWRVSNDRKARLQVPSAKGGPRLNLRILPSDSIFTALRSGLKLGDVAEIHKGVNWIARSDGKPQSAERTDVASNKPKEGFHPGAEKMRNNLTQFQLRRTRFLSLLDKHQDPSTRAHKRAWDKQKVVCNAGRFQALSPWRLAPWADGEGLAFTKQFFAIWPCKDISVFALAAVIASPLANAFSFERDLDRDNHIETLNLLPLPDRIHLTTKGELHRQAVALQNMFALKVLQQSPSEEKVKDALLRVDAAVLDAYNFSATQQHQLVKTFDGWVRPLAEPYENMFTGYFPKHFEEEITLSELVAITSDWEQTSDRKTQLIELKIRREASDQELSELERLKYLTEARGEYFDPLPLDKLAALQQKLESEGKWETET